MIKSLDELEKLAVSLAGKAAPWALAAGQLYLAGNTITKVFDIPGFWAYSLAAGLELVGIQAVGGLLEILGYNNSRRKADPVEKTGLSYGLVVVYFGGAVILTAGLAALDYGAKGLVIGLFPVLTLTALFTRAVSMQHGALVASLEAEKQERKAEKAAARLSGKLSKIDSEDTRQSTPEPVENVSDNTITDRLQAGRQAKADKRKAALLDVFAVNPKMPISEAARQVGASRDTVYADLADLEQAGVIKRNGHGVERLA